MSLWSRIVDAIEALRAGESLSTVFEKLRTPPEKSIGFTIAVIALGAKMAKADGRVTRAEVAAFREVFNIPPEEEEAAGRVYDLARRDVAGFEDYAHRVAAMFDTGDTTLCDLMEGLFHIAVADGTYNEAEDMFLWRVAEIFGMNEHRFRGFRSRFVPDAEPDPYSVLGIEPGTPVEEARAVWRMLVREHHPDRMVARGVPEEAVRMAEKRMIAINRAWEEINEAA